MHMCMCMYIPSGLPVVLEYLDNDRIAFIEQLLQLFVEGLLLAQRYYLVHYVLFSVVFHILRKDSPSDFNDIIQTHQGQKLSLVRSTILQYELAIRPKLGLLF